MRITFWLGALLLAGCAAPGNRNQAADSIRSEMNRAVQERAQPSKPEEVNNALLPPLAVGMPKVDNKSLDTKFDLTVNNTPASQVFMSIVSGTRYSVLLPPDISGYISLNLKDVTVFDAGKEWLVEPSQFLTKGRNTPYSGMTLKGRAICTIVGGRIVHQHLAPSGASERQ